MSVKVNAILEGDFSFATRLDRTSNCRCNGFGYSKRGDGATVECPVHARQSDPVQKSPSGAE
jgi:hypothetical protein